MTHGTLAEDSLNLVASSLTKLERRGRPGATDNQRETAKFRYKCTSLPLYSSVSIGAVRLYLMFETLRGPRPLDIT